MDLESREKTGHQVLLDHRVLWVQLGQEENVEEMDHRDLPDFEVLMELWDHLVNQEVLVKLDLLDFLEHLELRVTWEPQVTREVSVSKAQEEVPVNLECLENLVRWDHPEKMDKMERKEVLVCQELQVPLDSQDLEDSLVLMEVPGPQDQRD